MTRLGGRNYLRNNIQDNNMIVNANNGFPENNDGLIPFKRMYNPGEYVQIRTDGGWGLGADNYGDAMGGDPPPGGPQPQFGNIVRIVNFDHAEDIMNPRVPRLYYYEVNRLPYHHNLGNTLVRVGEHLIPANDIPPPVYGGRSKSRKSRKSRKSKRKQKTRK